MTHFEPKPSRGSDHYGKKPKQKDDDLTRAAIRNALRNNPMKRLRCLVVDRNPADQRLQSNIASVFQNTLDPDANYLHWQFGNGRKDGAGQIQNQLSKAFLKKAISR